VSRYSLSILEVTRVERKVSRRDAVLLHARRLRLEDLLDSEDFRASGSVKRAKRWARFGKGGVRFGESNVRVAEGSVRSLLNQYDELIFKRVHLPVPLAAWPSELWISTFDFIIGDGTQEWDGARATGNGSSRSSMILGGSARGTSNVSSSSSSRPHKSSCER
jgi:hypothetical protein